MTDPLRSKPPVERATKKAYCCVLRLPSEEKRGLTVHRQVPCVALMLHFQERAAPSEEAILRAFGLQSPDLAEHIERVLGYQVQVAEEFERLIRALPKNPPE